MKIAYTEQESLFFTYAKAIGIILVVLGHLPRNFTGIFSPYVYHMPLFFFIGGLLIKDVSITFPKVVKDFSFIFRYLFIWYAVTAGIAVAFNQLTGLSIKLPVALSSADSHNYFSYAIMRNMHANPFLYPAWFLLAYYPAKNIVKILISSLKFTRYRHVLVFCCAIIIGWYSMEHLAPLYKETKFWAYNLSTQIGVGMFYVCLGYLFRDHLNYFKHFKLFTLAVLILFIRTVNKYHLMVMSWSTYPDGFIIHFITSMAGIYAICFVAYHLSWSQIKSNSLKDIGTKSLDIMTLHVLAFFIFDFILDGLSMIDVNNFASYKELKIGRASFSYLYLVWGITFPILVHKILKTTKITLQQRMPLRYKFPSFSCR